MTYIELGYIDLAIASVLVVINAFLSLMLELRLQRHLLVAAVRMIVQLALVGVVLEFLFAVVSPLWTGLAALGMVLFAVGKSSHGKSVASKGFGPTASVPVACSFLRASSRSSRSPPKFGLNPGTIRAMPYPFWEWFSATP